MPTNISLLLSCSETNNQTEQATSYLGQLFDLPAEQLLKSPDYHLINSDQVVEDFSPLSIEQVRDLHAELSMHPYQGIGAEKYALFVICKIELASLPAQNALLKAIEEPPAHVKLVLTSAQPQQVLPTILSRCQLIELSPGSHTSPMVTTRLQVDLEKLNKANYTDLMAIAEQYKDKNDAQDFLIELSNKLHQELQHLPSKRLTTLMQQTLIAKGNLRKNVNIRLTLEELLFQFKLI